MSAGQKGRVVSEETRAKLAAAATGRKHSEETRVKMSGINWISCGQPVWFRYGWKQPQPTQPTLDWAAFCL
jgi:hypothetical protein